MNPNSIPSLPDHAPVADSDRPLRIDGALTIASVESWRLQIANTLTRSSAPGLDLAATTAIDVFGLQLLCAARRAAEARGASWRVLGAGAVALEACTAAGIEPAALGLSLS